MRERDALFPSSDALEEEVISSVTTMLKLYHDGGHKIGAARRDVLGVLMPTQSLLDHMLKKYKLQDLTNSGKHQQTPGTSIINKVEQTPGTSRAASRHVRGTIPSYSLLLSAFLLPIQTATLSWCSRLWRLSTGRHIARTCPFVV
jgi:hypothetical protein